MLWWHALQPQPRPTTWWEERLLSMQRLLCQRWGIIALLLLALAYRSAAIERPLVGYFATKNVIYGMIARNWARGEATWDRPTLDVLKAGYKSWHLLEVPVAAYVAGSAWRLLGGSLDVWGRGISIALSVASVGLMFAWLRQLHGDAVAWGASIALALSPVSVIFGQMFMLEASILCGMLLTAWSLEQFIATRRRGALLVCGVTFALLLLTKIYLVLLLLPLGVRFFAACRVGEGVLQRKDVDLLCVTFATAMLPAVAWVIGVYLTSRPSHPDSARIFYSLFDSVDAHQATHSLFLKAEFYQRLLKNLATLVLTPLGLMAALVGLAHPAARRAWPWLVVALVLIIALPRKFHELPYYYVVTLPGLCYLVGLGCQHSWQLWRWSPAFYLLCFLASVEFSLRAVAGPIGAEVAENRGVLPAARAIRKLTKIDEPVATMHGSTFDLLYYCDRPGWGLDVGSSTFVQDLLAAKQRGARYLVVAGFETLARHAENERLVTRLPRVRSGEDYCIYDLASFIVAPISEDLPSPDANPTGETNSTTIPAAPGTK